MARLAWQPTPLPMCAPLTHLCPPLACTCILSVPQLEGDDFDALFVSPLTRARQTAQIICSGRDLPTQVPGLGAWRRQQPTPCC